MKITVLCADHFVSIDGVSYLGLIWADQPADIRALQWDGDSGLVEYVDSRIEPTLVTEYPAWAVNAIAAWQVENSKPPVLLPTREENIQTFTVYKNEMSWIFDDQIVNPLPTDSILLNRNEILAWYNQMQKFIDGMEAGPIERPICPECVWQLPTI
jgi:hypothetical protein